MRQRLIVGAMAVVLLVAGATAGAQTTASPADLAALQGIIYTPAGVLPQVVRVEQGADTSRGPEIAARYSQYKFHDNALLFHNIGVSGRLHVTRRVKAGASVGYRTCSGCEGLSMASVDAEAALYHRAGS